MTMNRRHQMHHLFLHVSSLVVAANVMVGAFFISNNIVVAPTRHNTISDGRLRRDSHYVLLRSSSQEEPSSPNDQSTGGSTSTSIGDITQNLHGGKYQFSDTQYLAGSSLMGQQFAESLYSSSCHDEEDVFDEDDELPKWALKLQQPDEHDGKQLTGILSFSDFVKLHTISITNDERSWEKYYAYILPNNVEQYFQISPLRGHLAPRGGASNACDASKPYSDSASITIELIGSNNHAVVAGQRVLLVVGTEAEIWRYQVNFEGE